MLELGAEGTARAVAEGAAHLARASARPVLTEDSKQREGDRKGLRGLGRGQVW